MHLFPPEAREVPLRQRGGQPGRGDQSAGGLKDSQKSCQEGEDQTGIGDGDGEESEWPRPVRPLRDFYILSHPDRGIREVVSFLFIEG